MTVTTTIAAATVTPEIIPGQRSRGRLVGVFVAPDRDDLASLAVEALTLDLAGARGDRHYGFTRRSGSREPWYPRGTEMRSGRQLSIVSVEELAEVARRMDIPEIRPEWIGASLLVDGIPHLSFLPPGTRLNFPDGSAVAVELPNGPCRGSGRSIACHFPGRIGLDLDFASHAKRLRGVVGSVDRAGVIRPGEDIELRIPEQAIYRV